MKQEIAHETKWPYGVGTHYPSIRSWCIRCLDSCYDPETSGFGYDALCLCCREPLHALRIAELEAKLASSRKAEAISVRRLKETWQKDKDRADRAEAELAKFEECEGEDYKFDGLDHRHHIRKVYHMEGE